MFKASFITLGCKVNQYESQMMRERLEQIGFDVVEPHEMPDLFVINTCTVTSISDRKSRQVIRKLSNLNPKAKIVVTGCYAERRPSDIRSLKGVELVLSNDQKPLIHKHVARLFGIPYKEVELLEQCTCISRFNGQTRAIVKIQDGCNSFCSYCIVPYVRGSKIRSKPLDIITKEVEDLVRNNYREIVITGIHLGAYGLDLNREVSLVDVIRKLHQIPGVERIRLSSLEPMEVSDDLISAFLELPKLAHHLHVPLQSGSDRVLKLMNRNYKTSDFERIVESIRAVLPDVAITTDVIVGFPGETDQDFEKTFNFIIKIRPSRIHVFRYSPREGTPAANFPCQVPPAIADKRSHSIISLGKRLSEEFRFQMIGKTAEILIEDVREGKDMVPAGFTSNYIRTLVPGSEDKVGQLVKVTLVSAEDEHMLGRLLDIKSSMEHMQSPTDGQRIELLG